MNFDEIVNGRKVLGWFILFAVLAMTFPQAVAAHGDGSSGSAPVGIPVRQAPAWNAEVLVFAAAALGVGVLCVRIFRRSANRSQKRLLSLLMVGVMLTSGGSTLVLSGATQSTTTPVKAVSYQSSFASGYATGWFIQPGTSPAGTAYLTNDGGSVVLGASANAGQGILVFYNGGEDWKNISLTTTLKWVNGSIFYLNFMDEMTVANHSRYAVQFDLNSGTVNLVKTLQIGTNPVTTSAFTSARFALLRNVWYTVGVTANLGSLSVSINGASLLSATDPTPLLFGTVGVENDDVFGAFRIGSFAVTSTIPPQATWQQLGGPDGGQIQAIEIDPSNTSIIYAGAVHTGVMKSDNKGDFWREVGYSNGMTGTKANVVAVAPSNSSIIYASLEDSSTGGGAYRSDDRGLHWRALTQGLTGYFVETLVVDPTNPNVVYLATETNPGSTLPIGMEKSTDGGNTWTKILSAMVQSIAISKSNPSTIYVGTADQGIQRSDNGGQTWRSATAAQDAGQQFNRVVIDPQNPNIAVAHEGFVNLGGRTCGAILRTTDGGTTWNYISSSMPYFQENPCGPTGGIIDVAQAQTSTATFFAVANFPNGTGVMLRSDDSGSTWKMLDGRMNAVPQVVTIDPTDSNTAYVGTFGDGVYRTTDGGLSLTHLPTGFLGGGIYALAVYPGNDNVIYASRSINGQGEYSGILGTLSKSVDGGVTWTDFRGPPYNIVDIEIDPSSPATMYAATSGSVLAKGSGVWKSTDGGNTWVQKNQGLTYPNITCIAINPSATNMVLVGTGHRPYGGTAGNGIFKSTDGGNTWHKVNIPNYPVNQIAINPSNTNIMYAATFGGGMFKSTDAGENWVQSNSGISNNYVYALAINPSQPGTLYAGVNPFYADPDMPDTSVSLFKTTNGGTSWTNILLDYDVEWILLDPANPNNVYVGDHGGYISWSLDGGNSWSYGSDALRKLGGHVYMWGATTDPGRDALLVGTCGRGVFINRLATGELQTPIWLKIEYNQKPYSATFLANATLSDFSIKPLAQSMTLTVVGTAGSRAVANVSVPSNLLSGPYSVTVDGSQIAPLSVRNLPTKNLTQILVSLALSGRSQRLVVQGSLVTTTTTTTTATTAATTTSTTISTTPFTTTTTSSAVTTATSSTSVSSTTTTSPTLSTTASSVSTTSSQSTAFSSASYSSQTTTSAGGIPEFPVQLLAASIFGTLIAASYFVRSRRVPA